MGFKMKKGSGTANADTPGTFSSKDTEILKNLSENAFDVNAPVDPSFKSDAGEVTGTLRRISEEPIKFGDHGYGIKYPTVRDIEGKKIEGAGRKLYLQMQQEQPTASRFKFEGINPVEKIGKTMLTVSAKKSK